MTAGRALLVYTGLRILLLLAVGGLLYLTGARGFLLFLLAFVVSGALSLVWLDKPRGQASAGFGRWMGKRNARIEEAAPVDDEQASTSSADDEPQTESKPGEQQGQ